VLPTGRQPERPFVEVFVMSTVPDAAVTLGKVKVEEQYVELPEQSALNAITSAVPRIVPDHDPSMILDAHAPAAASPPPVLLAHPQRPIKNRGKTRNLNVALVFTL